MLRRGRTGVGVVVQWVVLNEAAPLNAGQAAEHATDDVQEGLGIVGGEGGGLHARHPASPMRRCTESRSTERLPRVPTYWTQSDVAQLSSALAGHTIDSLAAALHVDRSRAARFLRGDLMWTDYQLAKLTGGRAA